MQSTQRPSGQELCNQYVEVRAYTRKLCQPLAVEDYVPQPIVDVSPPKWNIAHTTWFFEEMILKNFAPEYRVFNPAYGYLFNSYYNSIGERTPRVQRGHLSRPTVAEVSDYRAYVDEAMQQLLKQECTNELSELVVIGLQHEQQHQELLLTDIKYILGCNPLNPAYDLNQTPEEMTEKSTQEWIEIPAGNYEIGFAGEGFCFDNELGRHQVWLDDFSVRSSLVTNGEYLEFIEEGCYRDFNLWHAEGWDWVQQNQIQAPLYWQNIEGQWWCFTLAGLREIQRDAPVCHLSFYEAAAFAEWKQLRLPTEFEWEAAANRVDWGLRWEWTNSAYLPYPYFKKAAGAVGEYNGKFMINQMVLRGASVATPMHHSRKTYRNFFPPSARWQFTGLRLAK